ncbi:MAG: hypothetical protein ACP5J8_02145 [Minisyncoccia bacterium]
MPSTNNILFALLFILKKAFKISEPYILLFLKQLWWLILFIILLRTFIKLYKAYKEKEEKKKKEIKEWITLSIKINREITQTPKAIEQVFAGLHTLTDGYISLEIIGQRKELTFLVRLPKKYRKVFESQFYAQYPYLEIQEVYDYAESFPPVLPNKDYDLYGAEIVLSKDDFLPIKTYPYFEENKEEKRIDPIANLIEATSQLQLMEYLMLQIIIKPFDTDKTKKWQENGQKYLNKLLGKKESKKITFHDWITAFVVNLFRAFYTPPVWPEAKKEEGGVVNLTPIDREVIEKVYNKLSKLCFETTIRFMYLSPPSIFDETASLAIPAYFKQFNIENLNSFKVDSDSITKVKTKLFSKRRTILKKYNFYQKFLNRALRSKPIILNTEELATIYHFPLVKVEASSLLRGLSRKGEPPPNLPI